MLSISKITSSKSANHYYEKDDYYAKNDPNHQKLSKWFGNIAQELNLKGVVQKEQFHAILEGNLPNGTKIGIKKDGKIIHDSGRDLTFSAPKSVSIMALVYNDTRLIEAHDKAVLSTLSEIEKNYLCTRTKKDQNLIIEKTNNLIAATFRHNLSRDLDPQLHTHSAVANITKNKDGKFKSAFFDNIYDNKKYLGAIYRSNLAFVVKKLGYEIEITGEECFFEIKSVSKEIRDIFSTRSKKIREFSGINASQKELEKAALLTRKAKKENNKENYQQIWQEKVRGFNIYNQPPVVQNNSTAVNAKSFSSKNSLDKTLNYSVKHLSERKTVFSHQDLFMIAMTDQLSILLPQDILDGIKRLEQKKIILPSKSSNQKFQTYTTTDLLQKEFTILNLMREGQAKYRPIITNKIEAYLDKSLNLNQGQTECANLILTTTDRVTGIQGYAGTGKTYMLKAVNSIATKHNYNLLGTATTGAATINLANEAKIKSITLQSFLTNYEGIANGRGTIENIEKNKKYFVNTILVVDEASMISTNQMKDLLTISKVLNFKIVLLGDIKQLDAVEAGIPLYLLQKNGMKTAYMTDIQRQKNQTLKEAVYNSIKGDIKAAFNQINISELNKKDESRSETNKRLITKMVDYFLSLDLNKRRNTLIITPDNQSRQLANDLISNALYKQRQDQHRLEQSTKNQLQKILSNNKISQPQIYNIYQNKNLSEAAKTRSYNFNQGDIIFFTKDRGPIGVKKNEYYKVNNTSTEQNLITITKFTENIGVDDTLDKIFKPNLSQITFNPEKLRGKSTKASFEVFKEESRIFKSGDIVTFRRGIKELDIINSDIAKIINITESAVKLELSNGNKITLNKNSPFIKHLDFSYAITAHKAQGLTCDNIIALVESWRKNLTEQKSFYVEISRARHEVTIFTDNKLAAIKQLESNTGIDISAIEHQSVNNKNQLLQNNTKSRSESKTRQFQTYIKNTTNNKHYIPNLTEFEIKEKFQNEIKNNINLNSGSNLAEAIDKAFSNSNKKVRFGQKKEYEICWHEKAGYVRDYKNNQYFSWGIGNIKDDGTMKYKEVSVEEMTKIVEEQKLKNKQAEIEKQNKFEEISIKATQQFNAYSKSGQSNYLKDKNIDDIKINGIKYVAGKVVIPVKDQDDKLWSLQYIGGDGQKIFLKDGKKQGNFFLITDNKTSIDKDCNQIFLAEGFATAATIHKATNSPVAVCFDAGNIEHVLGNLKTKYPNKEFVIAADNDLWKEINTGKEKAEIAAIKHNATVILPEFKYEHKDHLPTDFNDLEKLSGINEVRKQLARYLTPSLKNNRQIKNNIYDYLHSASVK